MRLRLSSGGWRALAAGRTFTNRTMSAPWAGRYGHTTVIDAAGAIYVIGGTYGGTTEPYYYSDVWASTDGGARAGLAPGVVGVRGVGVLHGYCRGYHGVPRGTTGVIQGYYRGTRGGTRGRTRGGTEEAPRRL